MKVMRFFNVLDNNGVVSAAEQSVDNEGCYPILTPTYQKESRRWLWKLVDDWNVDYDNGKYTYTVPAGMVTDGASIPRALWTFCGSPMELPRAITSLLHDYLYVTLSRKDPRPDCWYRKLADRIYRDLNIQLGMPINQARVEYRFLRMFAGSHWNDKI